jgi:hypothetical protein
MSTDFCINWVGMAGGGGREREKGRKLVAEFTDPVDQHRPHCP